MKNLTTYSEGRMVISLWEIHFFPDIYYAVTMRAAIFTAGLQPSNLLP